jgi:hypothetical protein
MAHPPAGLKIMKTLTIFFVAIYFILICSSNAVAEPSFLYRESGKLPSGLNYSLVIKESPYQRTPKSEPDDGSMWGIDGGYPTFIVQKFSLKLNGRDILIPRKFWADICNLSKASINEEKKCVVITIKGGDAAGSFIAKYKIKGDNLVERLVRHGEMSDEVWEKIEIHHDLEGVE